MRQLLQIVTIIRNLGILQNETIHRMNPYSMNPQKVLSQVTTESFDCSFFIYIYFKPIKSSFKISLAKKCATVSALSIVQLILVMLV